MICCKSKSCEYTRVERFIKIINFICQSRLRRAPAKARREKQAHKTLAAVGQHLCDTFFLGPVHGALAKSPKKKVSLVTSLCFNNINYS